MRIIVADCSAEYTGRLNATLPQAKRVLLIKADGSVLIFSELGAYKPLNWMVAPCTMRVLRKEDGEGCADTDSGVVADGCVLRVAADKTDDLLVISLEHVYSDSTYDLGEDPGLVKDGVEDIMAQDADGVHVAIEIKRHGGIDGVEQLTRYCDLLNRDPLLKPVRGIFAAQTISPQARVLAEDRGFTCLILDYDDMRGVESTDLRLF